MDELQSVGAWWMWVGFGVFVLAMLAMDLLLLGRKGAHRVSMREALAWSLVWFAMAMLFGAGFNAILSAAIYGPPQFEPRWGYVAGIAYLALMGSVVTFPLYFRLVRALGPGRAAYNGVLVPIIAMLLSTGFEGYRWSTLAVAGAVVAVAGLVLALRARSPSR